MHISRCGPPQRSTHLHNPTAGQQVSEVTTVVPYCSGVPASHVVLLLLAGLGAGIFNGVAGGGSLISFPILLALGYPALTANITNTIGIWPGYVASAAGFRRQIGD